MEKALISWSVPNMITIWLMLFVGFFALTLLMQMIGKKSAAPANNASSY